ncbi:MAG: sensor histidine kinase [Chitinophagales bacterium]
MREPTIIQYILLVFCCLLFALIGLYFLVKFSSIFRSRIKNELLRKNVAAFLVIFFLSSAMTPLGGGFSYMVAKFGWPGTIAIEIVASMVYTLIVFNIGRAIAENKKLKSQSFLKHKLLILAAIVISSMAINLATVYILYCSEKEYPIYRKYSLISNMYITGAIGIVYAVISYLDLQRKRKFDEKELELSQLRELKAKAELDALHSKVNPHFLYNALNSIADLSITDGKKARKMTVALADLFRYSINYSDHNYSTIKEEVEMAEVYLQIEKIRFEDQLNYSINISEDLNHYLVPRFVLQPIVENAVKHGLKATGKMTEINVEVKNLAKGLELIVADNGPPFPEELSPGYGVKSMYDKLDLLFPGEYEVHFANKPQKKVSIQIHKLMKNEPGV